MTGGSWLYIPEAVIQAYMAGTLLMLRKRVPEYRGLGLLLLCLSAYTLSRGWTELTTEGMAVVHAARLQLAAASLALAALASLVRSIPQPKRLWGWRWVVTLSSLGVVGSVSGLFFAEPTSRKALLGSGGVDAAIPSIVGIAFVVLAVLTSTVLVSTLFRPAKDEAGARLLLIAALPLWVAAFHDGLTFLGVFDQPPLIEHAGLVTAIAAAAHLARKHSRTARELQRRTLELQDHSRELDHVREELGQKEQMAALGELSTIIAHEVRASVGVLAEAARNIRDSSSGSPTQTTWLAMADEETNRLNRVMEDLLAYARPSSGPLACLHVPQLIRQAVELAHHTSSHIPSTAHDSRKMDHVWLQGDATALQRALCNVLINALEAAGPNGLVRVDVEVTGDDPCKNVEIIVSDTGEGMDPLVLAKAHEPFFTTRATGVGLGLAIAERVVASHGGFLKVQSDERQGTRVRMVLPACTPEETHAAVPPRLASIAAAEPVA